VNQRSAPPASEPLRLAVGLADYLAAVRRVPGPPPSLETARLIADRDAHLIAYPRPTGMTVCDSYVITSAGETRVRIYRPTGDGADAAILYFHGGGFAMGSVESYDCLATGLAEASDATVISVDYARLPDTTPRAILREAADVLTWVHAMAGSLAIDTARIAVAGDSAGAFIATQLAASSRASDLPALTCQLLCYGVFDLNGARDAYFNARDPVLTRPIIDAMITTYRTCQARDAEPLPPPIEIPDLAGMSPVIMLSAEHDPLMAEGLDYAARLNAAGVVVEARTAAAMCHGFLRAVAFSQAARDEMRWLGAAFRNIDREMRN
jgi:acetyl esterase